MDKIVANLHLNDRADSGEAVMQNLLRKLGRRGSARLHRRTRLADLALGGTVGATLWLTSSALLGEVTSLEVSPLVFRSTLVGRMDAGKEIGIVLALPSKDPAGLAAFVKHVSAPSDPAFHQYITADEFAVRFGGNEADYCDVKIWATANGLRISQESRSRTILSVRGTVSQLETLFKTQLNTYRDSDGQTFYSASVKPSVPAEIAPKLSAVIGLTAEKPLHSLTKVGQVLGEDPVAGSSKLRADSGGTGPGGSFSCSDLRSVYSIPTWGDLDKRQVVAVFEQGFYRKSDVEKYFKRFGVGSQTKQTPVSVNKSPVVLEQEVELEACLDLDMLVGMNPEIGEVQVYVDDYNYDPFPVAIVNAFQTVAEATTLPTILSVSYGEDEGSFGTSAATAADTALQQLAAEGVTVLASSGDNGAYGDYFSYPYNVSYPSSDPYITGVGGTTLFVGPKQSHKFETAWNELEGGYGATGGGISILWTIPEWQANTGYGSFYLTDDGGSVTYRNVPDVAAVADPLTGVGVYCQDQGGWIEVGGTSVASPLWGGYLSTINATFGYFHLGPIGFFNPILYNAGAVSSNGFSDPIAYLYGVIEGQNGYPWSSNPGYFNGYLYSNTTGNGTPWGYGFAAQVLTGLSQPGTAPGSIYGLEVTVKGTTANFTWTASSGATGYVLGIYHPVDGINVTTCYLSKTNKLTVTDLPRVSESNGVAYYALVWGFNASGGAFDPVAIYFNTK